MTVRILGTIAAMGFFAACSAHAQSGSGDIVDQVLQGLPPSPNGPAPAGAASFAPSGGASFAPSSSTSFAPPTVIAPRQASAPITAANGDIVDRAMQTLPQQTPSPRSGVTPSVAWTGVYAGVNLGGGWAHGGGTVSCINVQTNTPSGCDVIADSALKSSGVLGGGQVGYMTPLDLGWGVPLMVGVEGDIQGSGIGGSENLSGPFPIVGFPETCSPCNYTASQKIDWFATLRGRIGVPLDNVFVYGTGGLIFGGVTAAQTLSFAGSPGYVANTKSTMSGPTAGGGVEVLVPGSQISAKIEALYYDLGNLPSIAVPQTNFAANFSEAKNFGFQGTMIRLGVNYRLGGIGGY